MARKVPHLKPKNLDQIEANISFLEGKMEGDKKAFPIVLVIFTIIPFILLVLQFRGIRLAPPMVYILFAVSCLLGVFMLIDITTNRGEYSAELKRYQRLRKRYLASADAGISIETMPTQANSWSADQQENYFRKVLESELANFDEQYQKIQGATNNGIWLPIFLVLAGLGNIAIGILLGYQNFAYINMGYVIMLVGLLIIGMGSILFYWNNIKNIRQLKTYQNGLARMQKILLYFKLIESAKNEKDKEMMIQKMVDYVIDIDFL